MNKWCGIGRVVADPEVRYTQGANPTCIAKYRIAVNRSYKREGEPDADFLNIVSFGKNAEFVEKFLQKGMQIGVVGRIQTGSYDHKDGYKVYTTDIVVEEHTFCGKKEDNGGYSQGEFKESHDAIPNRFQPRAEQTNLGGFMPIDSDDDSDIPF